MVVELGVRSQGAALLGPLYMRDRGQGQIDSDGWRWCGRRYRLAHVGESERFIDWRGGEEATRSHYAKC